MNSRKSLYRALMKTAYVFSAMLMRFDPCLRMKQYLLHRVSKDFQNWETRKRNRFVFFKIVSNNQTP